MIISHVLRVLGAITCTCLEECFVLIPTAVCCTGVGNVGIKIKNKTFVLEITRGPHLLFGLGAEDIESELAHGRR